MAGQNTCNLCKKHFDKLAQKAFFKYDSAYSMQFFTSTIHLFNRLELRTIGF